MLNSETILMLAILSQTVMITFVSTSKWVKNQFAIFRAFPPIDYPHFYIFSLRLEVLHLFIRIVLDIVVTFCIVYFLFYRSTSFFLQDVFSSWATFTAIQLIPSLYSLIVLQLASRLRRQRIKLKKTSLAFVHRSVFDHISIAYIFFLSVATLLTLNIIVSNEQLVLAKKVGLTVLFLFTNTLLVKQIMNAIHGKTNDKLINSDDRENKRRQDVQRGYIGIAASICIFALFGMAGVNRAPESAWLIIPLSFFVQLAMYNRSARWHAHDMNVYKVNSGK